MHICLTGDQWFLYRKLVNSFVYQARQMDSRLSPSCVRFLRERISVYAAFTRVLHGWAGKSEQTYIYVHTTITTKVDALMMSADMCMNNVTSACMASVAFITNAPCCTMIRMSTVSIWVSRYFRYYPDSNQIVSAYSYLEIIIKLGI